MGRSVRCYVAALACLLLPLAELSAQELGKVGVSKLQAARVQFNAGNYAAAAKDLESIPPQTARPFEVEELLGMSYASMSDDAKAIPHLRSAVRLQPDSGAARTNLATSLSRSGKTRLAGSEFKEALKLEPESYAANHNLGEFYIQAGDIALGQPFLAHAHELRPAAYDNGYDLAMADLLTGNLSESKRVAQGLIEQKNTGELHNLLGQIDEKSGDFVEAANEYETAAHMDPSEDNLFDWGGELLLHRTYEPAIDVFRAASVRYPKSPRILIGLGMALYARGLYKDAIKSLLEAADLDPSEQRCYFFLSKAYESSPDQADDVIRRFARYAQLQPENALAQYYYAMSLWHGKQASDSGPDVQQVEALLKHSIAINPSIPEAHMLLGNIYAGLHQYELSVPQYTSALALEPNLPDAHYRLGTDYVHMGLKDSAQAEFAVYEKLRAAHLSNVDKERAAVKQFVYSSKDPPQSGPS